MTAPTIILPEKIEVVRERNGRVHVLIDGEALPYAISGAVDDAPTVRLRAGDAPAVTLTLVAKTVQVVDALLEGSEIVLEHGTREP